VFLRPRATIGTCDLEVALMLGPHLVRLRQIRYPRAPDRSCGNFDSYSGWIIAPV